MAKDDKKTKAGPPPKTEIAAKKKDEAAPKDKAASGAEPAKAEIERRRCRCAQELQPG